jgi:alkanesulfonate monooxygenase SsuD/methylene tetrahydromethanopterin reductase-like flavin-dependent oxidoreductase (luciferase family)
VAGYSGLPTPVQKPHPPILIGGSKKRVLSFAARQADIVSINNVAWADPAPFDEVQRRVAYVRTAAGDRFDQLEIEVSPSYTEITDDVDGTIRRIAPTLRNANPDILRHHPNVLVGSVDQMVDRLQALRESIAINYITIPSAQADAFAPVVSGLAGL